MRRAFVCAAGLATVASLALGCVVTLPFDDLTAGVASPIARWRFEEGTGSVANDDVGAHQGFLDEQDEQPPTWTREGRRGGALSFAALDGWVLVPSLSGAAFPRRGSYAAWVRFASFPPDGADLLEVDDEDEDDERRPISLSASAEGVFLVFASASAERVLVARAIPTDKWTLVVASWDIPGNSARLYVRPERAEAYPLAAGDLPPSFTPGSANLLFLASGGVLDDVSVYDRMLSPNELGALD